MSKRALCRRTQIRRGQRSTADLGDERARPVAGRRALCIEPHRRFFDRLRLRVERRDIGRFRREGRIDAARRIRQFLHRTRADVQVFLRTKKTPGRLIRLSYAIEMRYGVLHDIANAVFNGKPVPLSMIHVNVLWQGDANSYALQLLAQVTTPPARSTFLVPKPPMYAIGQKRSAGISDAGRNLPASLGRKPDLSTRKPSKTCSVSHPCRLINLSSGRPTDAAASASPPTSKSATEPTDP